MKNEIESEIEAGTRDGRGVYKMGEKAIGKFEILDQVSFGRAYRFSVDRCRDRFGSIVYMTFDHESEDPIAGGPACIGQSGSLTVAIERTGDDLIFPYLVELWSL
jgi:hypothetical protein